jgi:hypothetical protein
MNLAGHLSVPEPGRDLDWLKSALQTAIALEHSTLPLYLGATYSLRVLNYTGYNLLRSIAMEEMVHMALVCNMLAAIGGTPQLKNLAPTYPSQGLPGGAEPDLFVCLAPLSKLLLQNFMRLETPAFLLPDDFKSETYPTISKLYDAIRIAIVQNGDAIRNIVKNKKNTSNQVGDNIGFSTFTESPIGDVVADMDTAISEILTQGEGCTSRTLHANKASESEQSHYCKFAQLYYGNQYQAPAAGVELTRESAPQFFRGYQIPFPEVSNLLMVPADGYARLLQVDPQGAAVSAALLAFDQAYTGMMSDLDSVWNGPADRAWPTLGHSVETMGKLRVLGCFNIIMKYQVPTALVAKLKDIYPDEFDRIAAYTNLNAPVFYAPRFRNLNAAVTAPDQKV